MILLSDILQYDTVEQISEAVHIMLEFPGHMHDMNWDYLSNNVANAGLTLSAKKHYISKKTCDDFVIYSYTSKGTICDMWTYKDSGLTTLFFQYVIKNNILILYKVWQDSIAIGVCRKYMMQYYLNEYDGITTGDLHSLQGQKFSDKLIDCGLKNDLKVYVIHTDKDDFKKQIFSIEDTKKFYSTHKFQFLISKV